MSYSQPMLTLLLGIAFLSAMSVPAGTRRRILVGSVLALVLWAWPPFAWLVLLPFESRYEKKAPEDKDVEAIVVLSSAVFPPYPPLPTSILGSDTFERTAYAAWLHTHWRAVPVLATGGGSRGGLAYAITMGEALEKEGVPRDLVWLEGKSTSTYENAEFSVRILREKHIRKIALVTEAYHMVRAAACFRKLGIEVVPAACGFHIPLSFRSGDLAPTWEAIAWNEASLHEMVGLIWYRFKGRI